jgi:hypothetical protein
VLIQTRKFKANAFRIIFDQIQNMRKALLLVGVLALALGITYLVLHDNNTNQNKSEERDVPLAINSKSSAFNKSVAGVLDSYYSLADAFVRADTSFVHTRATTLSHSIDSIKFDQFKADSAIVLTAQSLAQSVQGDIAGLIGEKEMEQKKREFNMVTDELYSLIRAVKYDGSTVFHIRCATAFPDSTEAYWLSPTPRIVNPYLGINHPAGGETGECGEVSDSIHFSAPVVTE